jgi:hypothetical protein
MIREKNGYPTWTPTATFSPPPHIQEMGVKKEQA